MSSEYIGSGFTWNAHRIAQLKQLINSLPNRKNLISLLEHMKQPNHAQIWLLKLPPLQWPKSSIIHCCRTLLSSLSVLSICKLASVTDNCLNWISCRVKFCLIQAFSFKKIIFLFLNQNIWDGSFEHPNHMLKTIGKKYLQF